MEFKYWAAKFHANQKGEHVFFLDWDYNTWVFDTWSSSQPDKKVMEGERRKIVSDELDDTDIRVTTEKGVVCILLKKSFVLFNPISGNDRTLPPLDISFDPKAERNCFLGYLAKGLDYKLLSVTKPAGGSVQYHLLTLGVNTWKRLVYQNEESHFPEKISESVCIDGMIYYTGRTKEGSTLIKFDLRLESFTLIQVPTELQLELGLDIWYNLQAPTLFNFHGKLTLGDSSILENSFRLWSLGANSTWTKTILSTAALFEGFNPDKFCFFLEGASACKQRLILTIREAVLQNPRGFIIYFNPNSGTIERFPVQIPNSERSHTVWNITPSAILL